MRAGLCHARIEQFARGPCGRGGQLAVAAERRGNHLARPVGRVVAALVGRGGARRPGAAARDRGQRGAGVEKDLREDGSEGIAERLRVRGRREGASAVERGVPEVHAHGGGVGGELVVVAIGAACRMPSPRRRQGARQRVLPGDRAIDQARIVPAVGRLRRVRRNGRRARPRRGSAKADGVGIQVLPGGGIVLGIPVLGDRRRSYSHVAGLCNSLLEVVRHTGLQVAGPVMKSHVRQCGPVFRLRPPSIGIFLPAVVDRTCVVPVGSARHVGHGIGQDAVRSIRIADGRHAECCGVRVESKQVVVAVGHEDVKGLAAGRLSCALHARVVRVRAEPACRLHIFAGAGHHGVQGCSAFRRQAIDPAHEIGAMRVVQRTHQVRIGLAVDEATAGLIGPS